MISLMSRNDVLQETPNLKNTIISLQKIMADYYYDGNAANYDDADNDYPEDDTDCFDMYNPDETYSIKENEYGSRLSIKNSNLKDYTAKLAAQLLILLAELKTKELYIISHLKIDFFGNRNNKFKPLKQAYKDLEEVTGSKSYKEAFRISLDELPAFISILFWTERCDPSTAEYVFFADADDRFNFCLCKYGNLHTIEYGDSIFTDAADTLGWDNDDDCYNKFSDYSRIEGRMINF